MWKSGCGPHRPVGLLFVKYWSLSFSFYAWWRQPNAYEFIMGWKSSYVQNIQIRRIADTITMKPEKKFGMLFILTINLFESLFFPFTQRQRPSRFILFCINCCKYHDDTLCGLGIFFLYSYTFGILRMERPRQTFKCIIILADKQLLFGLR